MDRNHQYVPFDDVFFTVQMEPRESCSLCLPLCVPVSIIIYSTGQLFGISSGTGAAAIDWLSSLGASSIEPSTSKSAVNSGTVDSSITGPVSAL